MAKTWAEKLAGGHPPHVDVLDKAFGGFKAGQKLFIASPRFIADAIRRIPAGKSESVAELRDRLARQHKADGTCPLTTSIFVRIAAEAAWDELQAGGSLDNITPFWRVVAPGTTIAAKLRCGEDFLRTQRKAEGISS